MHAIAGVIVLATTTVWGAAASAQTYPSRPINMVVPFPPGGNTDIMARALQNEISKALGQTVVIINKGGAAGTLGLIDLTRAAPDGYTIALTPNNPLTAQPHLQKLPYAMDGFRYICLTYYAPYVLIAGPKARHPRRWPRWRKHAQKQRRARSTRPSPRASTSRRVICPARLSAGCSTRIRSKTPMPSGARASPRANRQCARVATGE